MRSTDAASLYGEYMLLLLPAHANKLTPEVGRRCGLSKLNLLSLADAEVAYGREGKTTSTLQGERPRL
jgi:hypothetical protein